MELLQHNRRWLHIMHWHADCVLACIDVTRGRLLQRKWLGGMIQWLHTDFDSRPYADDDSCVQAINSLKAFPVFAPA